MVGRDSFNIRRSTEECSSDLVVSRRRLADVPCCHSCFSCNKNKYLVVIGRSYTYVPLSEVDCGVPECFTEES